MRLRELKKLCVNSADENVRMQIRYSNVRNHFYKNDCFEQGETCIFKKRQITSTHILIIILPGTNIIN